MADCPLCGSPDNTLSFKDKGYDILACGNCGLFFIDPYPLDAAQHHRAVSRYDYREMTVLSVDRRYRAEEFYYEEYFPILEPHIRRAGSILDVGCGTGYLLERCSEFGLKRVGIELNKDRAEFARTKTGCQIHQVPIETFTTDQRFDVITLMNVLSHVCSFDGLFKAIKDLLNPGGKIIIKTGVLAPNVKRTDVFDWEIPDHLHFLGLETIHHICRKYGLILLEHHRRPLSEELFSRRSLLLAGRSTWRNAVKKILAYTPLVVELLRLLYERRHDRRVFSSLMLLTVQNQ